MVGSKGTLLPLLMIKGVIKSLDNLEVEDFQSFIPFMTQCAALGSPNLKHKPVWWLDSVDFLFPLMKPSDISTERYRRRLRSIVFRCYSYYREEHILAVCGKLAPYWSRLESEDNGDDSSSMFLDGKHLLTFQNLHTNYDRQVCTKVETPQKSHLRLLPPAKNCEMEITNVFLCDCCDAEFTTQTDITAHERLCYGWPEPADEPEPPAPSPSDLLGYLQLGATNDQKQSASKEPPTMILIKNLKFEFSSHFGQSLLNNHFKKDLVRNPQKCVQQYEWFCNASTRIGKSRDSYELRNLYKGSGKKNEREHCHQYSFSRRERLDRYSKLRLTVKTGLDSHGRALLAKMKKCSVRLNRWEMPIKTPPEPIVIDLCSSDDDDC